MIYFQRYVKEKGQFDYIIPPTIERNPELKEKLLAFRKQLAEDAKENGGLGVDL